MMKNRIIQAVGVMLVAALGNFARTAEPQEIALWPADDPVVLATSGTEKIQERGKNGKVDRGISGVTKPTITVYLPAEEKNAGAAVVICPGGGYGGLAIDKEGHDMARWLNKLGVVGIVLKYRMPKPDVTKDQKPWPLLDAQRAIRLARSRAKEWRIDPARIGIMGFSAGGHLASTAGTHFDAGESGAADPVARMSSRPDFLILGYPVITFKDPIAHKGSRANLIGKTPDPKMIELYSNELQVTPQTPPAFLVHAKDDGVKVDNSLLFQEAMKKAGVPCELQLYEKGGHGFGLGVNGGEVATWPERCAAWMKAQKILH
ncbi:MAG: alpha/beta hydrolase [Candidatus Sumerlaeota bacterium]|nr:alpha/beta hydrolase [Candidatus Sumerlaeota bacterium]